MDYRSLIQQLSKRNPSVTELKFIEEDPEGFKWEPLADQGMVNKLLLITSSDGKNTAVLKHGRDTMAGPGMDHIAISLERQDIEAKAQRLMNEKVPGCVPKLYCFDEKLHIVAMEYLTGMVCAGTPVRSGDIDENLAFKMGDLLGKLHYRTHKDLLPEQEWTEIQENFKKVHEVRGMFQDICFRRAYKENDTYYEVPEELVDLHRNFSNDIIAEGLDQKCIHVHENQDCFVHGDPYVFSFMTDGNNVKLIDMEFAGPGPAMFDLGLLITIYVLCGWQAHQDHSHLKEGIWRKTQESIHTLVDAYEKAFSNQIHVLGEHMVPDLVLMVGAHIFRWSVIASSAKILNFNSEGKIKFMTLGYNLMKNHLKIKTIGEMMDLIFME